MIGRDPPDRAGPRFSHSYVRENSSVAFVSDVAGLTRLTIRRTLRTMPAF